MKNRIVKIAIILAVAATAGGPSFAKKPDAPGNSGTQKSAEENSASVSSRHDSEDSQAYFNADRRNLIRNYYSNSEAPKNCPPGLAKKNNGCQPPGQVKKWRKGEPLPRDMVYTDLPRALIDELGRTPEGNRLVQIDSDVLLINAATGMVLDAFAVQY